MPERIIKNKRVSKCRYCDKDITGLYKVRFKYDEREKRGTYYHLSCYQRHILRRIKAIKDELKILNKAKRKLGNYKKHIIVENL